MSRKVLVITVSPRPESITRKMAEAFAEGAREAGHEVTIFDAGHKKMQGCNACNMCWSKGNACVVNDDFTELSQLLEQNDTLLISTPLYWVGFPAQIKSAIDRLYAYGGTGGLRPLGIKQSCMFVCGEAPDEKFYEPIIQSYKLSTAHLGITDRGIIQTCASQAEGTLAQCKEAGLNV